MEKKQEIIKLLKNEEMALSKICGILKMNIYYGERYCDELIKEKKLSLRKDGKTKYYRVLKGGKN